jgi:hypothetical protein
MNIITNNQPRPLMYLCDFSESEQAQIRKDFDWMDPSDLECNYGFFRYRGCIYHLQDFLRVANEATGDLEGWDGYTSDTFFSGTIIRLVEDDYDHVIVGRYYS